MQINFESPEDYHEILNSELGKAVGLMELTGDRSAMGAKAIDILGDDIGLDDIILDFEDT